MVESDLASIAACLPVLYSLFRRISLEAVIHSVRSIISTGLSLVRLQGLRSDTARIKNDNDSTISHAQMLPSYLEPATVEAYALRDYFRQSDDHNVPQGEILVRDTVTQSQDAV